jgi:hypothetical protein
MRRSGWAHHSKMASDDGRDSRYLVAFRERNEAGVCDHKFEIGYILSSSRMRSQSWASRGSTLNFPSDDWLRSVELIETYASLGLGIVDASLVAVAERLNLTEIATVNGRDFRVVRPKHCDGFTLLPEELAQS